MISGSGPGIIAGSLVSLEYHLSNKSNTLKDPKVLICGRITAGTRSSSKPLAFSPSKVSSRQGKFCNDSLLNPRTNGKLGNDTMTSPSVKQQFRQQLTRMAMYTDPSIYGRATIIQQSPTY